MQLYPDIPSEGVPYGEFDNSTFPENSTQWRRIASITGDIIMIAPCRLFSQIASFSGYQPVYRYRANLTYPGIPATLGSTHGIDIPYVWNFPTLQLNPETSETVEFVSRAWVSFINDLDPNHHGVEGIPSWNPYSTLPTGENFVIAVNNFTTEPDVSRFDGISFINSVLLGL
jgi:carboxylesterase type B